MRPCASRSLFLVTVVCVVAAACVDVQQEAPPAIGVSSMFDPATNAIPLPNDLLKDAKTGLLAIPASAGDSTLTGEVKASLARLDGWLTSQTPTIPFDGEIDVATLTAETVMVFDITGGTATKIDPATYYTVFNVGVAPATAAPYNLMIKNKIDAADTTPGPKLPKGYAQGHEYFVIVTDGVKGKDGKPITANAVFELLKCTAPIADGQGRSLTLLGPTGDKTADDAIAAELIQLETARAKVYDPAFKAVEALGVTRKGAAAFTAFSIQGGSRAVFNPTLVGNRLPQPIDTSTAKANAALDAKPSIYFDLPLDAATVPGGVKMYKLSGGAPAPVTVTAGAAAAVDETGLYKVTIAPAAALEPSTTYLVVTDDSILGTNKIRTAALAYFSIVRYANPLVDGCSGDPTKAKLNSPFLDNTIDLLVTTGVDPVKATPDNWSQAYGFLIANLCQLEAMRISYGPLFTAAVAGGTPRENITALWSFTTAAE